MGSEVLARAAVGAVDSDGTGRSRKGSAKLMGHTWIMGTAGGRSWGSRMDDAAEVLGVITAGDERWMEEEQQHRAGSGGRARAVRAALRSRCPLLC